MSKTRIYVGNLPNDMRERELEDLFDKVSIVGHRLLCLSFFGS